MEEYMATQISIRELRELKELAQVGLDNLLEVSLNYLRLAQKQQQTAMAKNIIDKYKTGSRKVLLRNHMSVGKLDEIAREVEEEIERQEKMLK